MRLHGLSSIVCLWSILSSISSHFTTGQPLSVPNGSSTVQADVSVSIGDLTLIAAPQAVQVLAKLPDVFAELAPETTETTTETTAAQVPGARIFA